MAFYEKVLVAKNFFIQNRKILTVPHILLEYKNNATRNKYVRRK